MSTTPLLAQQPQVQPNLSETLCVAQDALHALLDSGVPFTDARIETLITLIIRASNFHRHSSHKSSHQSARLSIKSPIFSPSNSALLPRSKDVDVCLSSENTHTTSPVNSYNAFPSALAPVGRTLPGSKLFSFQEQNQITIVAARAALEHAIHPNCTSAQPTFHNRNAASESPSAIGIQESVSVSPPASVIQAARTLYAESLSKRIASKRKDSKSILRPVSRISSPRLQNFPRNRRAHEPPSFEFQNCGDFSASHVFQIKAQVEAFRRLLRDADIPAEIHIASRGRPSKTSIPSSGCVIEHVATDNDAVASKKPIIHVNGMSHFDARRLIRHPVQHAFAKDDIVRSNEEDLPSSEIQDRIAVAQVHHDRLHARILETEDAEVQVAMDKSFQFDPRISQQRAEIIQAAEKLNPPVTSHPTESLPRVKPLHERKSPRRRERGLPSLDQSVARDAAAVPISVVSSGRHRPSYIEFLLEREKRVGSRLKERLGDIQELKLYAPHEIRRSLAIEEKQLSLHKLQRSVRKQIMSTMQSVLDRPRGSDLRPAAVAKWRRQSAGYAYGNTIRHGSYLGATRIEESYRRQQVLQRKARRHSFLETLLSHGQQLRSWCNSRQAVKKRLLKDLERYFRDRSREEERKKKKEQLDRLRALRSNNQDEYLELLKSTKNKRLIQLLKQTDEYLMQIGAQVERQKQTARAEDARMGIVNENAGKEPEPNSTDGNLGVGGSGQAEDELNQLKKRRNDYYTISHTISEKVWQPDRLLGGKLKHYQLEGLEWLVSLYNNNLNGILADEMGLGKTIQTLSLITYLCEVKNVHGPFLIIVPLSVVSNWVRELDKWAPSIVKVVYKGDPATRKSIQTYEMHGGNYNVLLTTYEFVVKDKNVLGRIRWKYIIMDEGHRMKNADCKLALTLGAKYTSRNRLLLTGTPLQNNMTELWALLNFLLPTIFSSAETFETWFNAPFQDSVLGESAELNEEENLLIISRLHQVLRPFMLRRLKVDVESQLPDKVELVFKCDMSIWQKVLYRQLKRRLGVSGGSGNVGIRSFNNMVMQLKKVCNHPYLFYQEDEIISVPPEFLMRAAGKFELLDHCLRKLKKSGHRVLIFSQMTAALDYLEYFLGSIGMKNLRLDGTTKADDRQEMLEMFNAENSEYFCFLLSTRAGGLGLNLQTADTVIIFDSDWNPMMDLQAQDRAHRIGQTREVRVYRLICSGSIEEKILKRANRKLQMDAQVIQAGQFNNKSNDNDRQEMLKDLLRQQADDEISRKEDVTSLSDINRQLARSDQELELFEEMDIEFGAQFGDKPRLLTSESELPTWVLLPEIEEKHKQSKSDLSLEHGRGRRKRKEIYYDDNLTEREWALAMEEEGDIADAVKRKRQRLGGDSRKAEYGSNDVDKSDELDISGKTCAKDGLGDISKKESSEDFNVGDGEMNGVNSLVKKDFNSQTDSSQGIRKRTGSNSKRKRGRPRKNSHR